MRVRDIDYATTRAVLFDVDGALVDSNYLHVQAWAEALVAVDRPAPTCKVHRAIGMDSAKLPDRLLGSDADGLGERVAHLHAEKVSELAPQLSPCRRSRFPRLTQQDRRLAGCHVVVRHRA